MEFEKEKKQEIMNAEQLKNAREDLVIFLKNYQENKIKKGENYCLERINPQEADAKDLEIWAGFRDIHNLAAAKEFIGKLREYGVKIGKQTELNKTKYNIHHYFGGALTVLMLKMELAEEEKMEKE